MREQEDERKWDTRKTACMGLSLVRKRRIRRNERRKTNEMDESTRTIAVLGLSEVGKREMK